MNDFDPNKIYQIDTPSIIQNGRVWAFTGPPPVGTYFRVATPKLNYGTKPVQVFHNWVIDTK